MGVTSLNNGTACGVGLDARYLASIDLAHYGIRVLSLEYRESEVMSMDQGTQPERAQWEVYIKC